MPAVDNELLKNKYKQSDSLNLKPFKFAHPFNVSLTPENSGQWYTTEIVNVWQLRIKSTGAFSLNLIFDKFRVPKNSKLFVVNEENNDIKGAYTDLNNSEMNFFSVEPISGDEILIQYEEPINPEFRGELRIAQVSHDFTGINSPSIRRPLGISGSCNLNINCDIVNGTENIRDAVCRIIIDGTDICTGTLMNNTAKDKTPYILTAYHCIPSEKKAQTSIFLFNYESPYCTSIDGDISRSISGSSLKASFDSLDFALVRLNSMPPYFYRPYFAGWNRQNIAPLNSLCIHHPLGDIKKVSIDKDAAVSSRFTSVYHKSGFWKINNWESGATERGSSGGPIFDQNQQLTGTLTGGEAMCSYPNNDYFAKFSLAWDYKKASNQQLKFWLDPLNTNTVKLNGMEAYLNPNLCMPYTNIKDSDAYYARQIITNLITKKGYWSGTNTEGYTDFAEQYKVNKNCEIQGITLGIAKNKRNGSQLKSFIDVSVFRGKNKPEILVYTESFDVSRLWPDAMNYLAFSTPVKVWGEFFVTYNVSKMNNGDTIAVYMANRKSEPNSFFLKNSTGWVNYNSQNINGYGSALVTELIACNIDSPTSIDGLSVENKSSPFFPNPLTGSKLLILTTIDEIECFDEIAIYDLLGKRQNLNFSIENPYKISFSFKGYRSGIYFVHVISGGKKIVGKIAYTQ